jgi:hypothetical protein
MMGGFSRAIETIEDIQLFCSSNTRFKESDLGLGDTQALVTLIENRVFFVSKA